MRSGKVETLLILGGNPVYNAPAKLAFAAALAKVPRSVISRPMTTRPRVCASGTCPERTFWRLGAMRGERTMARLVSPNR